MLKIAAMGSTLRAGSVNQGLIRAAMGLGPQHNLEIVPVNLNLPLFNQDLEPDNVPESVLAMHRQIDSADAVLFSVAEYNYSLSSVLKNAIDWASRTYLPGKKNHPLLGKPCALVGAGGGMGTSRAQYHLRQVLVFLDMHPLNKPEVFVQRWGAPAGGERFNKDGDLTDDATRDKLGTMLAAFEQWIRVFQTDDDDATECVDNE